MPSFAQFETRASQQLPSAFLGIVSGDFNKDGKMDVAVTGDYLSILLGNGDGTFQPPVNYSGLGEFIAAADFNGDGKLDLVTADFDNHVSVFLGDGDGKFEPAKITQTTGNCTFVAIGDFNGDHKPDLVVIDHPYISVLLGNGDGTFQPPSDNNTFVDPQWLAVGDFNRDHKLDVAAVGSFGSNSYFGILPGNGDGTLQDASTHPLLEVPRSVTVADFNRDGNLDLAIGEAFSGVAVVLGNGDGSFQSENDYLIAGGGVLVGDFNSDGILDIVSGFEELVGIGDGTFERLPGYKTAGASLSAGLVAAGDFNGDGLLDVVYVERAPADAVVTMLNTGVVTFSQAMPLTFPTQLIGTTSTPMTATLTNKGTSSLTFSSVSYSGKPFHAQTTCKGSVAPGESCTVSVAFSAQVKDVATGTVTFNDSASSKPQVMELVGTGTIVKFTPAQLTFPPQKENTQSPAQTLRLTNTGSTPLDFTHTIEIGGPDNFNFFESDNCTTSLDPGASCSIHVVFAPRQRGQITQSVIANDNGGGSPQSAGLFGTGIKPSK